GTVGKRWLRRKAKASASGPGRRCGGSNPGRRHRPCSPAEARRRRAGAGMRPGARGQCDVGGSDSSFRGVAQAVSGYLQAVGVRATIKPYETGVLLNDIIPGGKTGEMWQNQWGGWTYDYDNTAYLMYHSGQKWNPYDNDPMLNAMLEAQRTVYDVKKREAMLQEIAGYVADQALELPLYSLNTIVGVNKRVKNLEVPGDIRFRFVDTTVE
ncbi:ABC transporter substrate-binding protein, partial [Achromobacter ruhlandii]|nr:ABC transporter substrate-binding protein [Achromobacter ruhlandii]